MKAEQIISSKNYIPIGRPTHIKKGGNDYVVLTHDKKYSLQARVGKFCKAFFLTLISLGFAALSDNIRNSFKKAVKGHFIKKIWIKENSEEAKVCKQQHILKLNEKEKKDLEQENKHLVRDPIAETLRSFNNNNVEGTTGGVYISTNEAGSEKLFEQLGALPKRQNAVHVGFSGWFNLDVIAERQSSYGIIVDFNPDSTLFIEETLALIRKSDSREDFIKKINEFISDCSIQFSLNILNLLSMEEEIENEFIRPGSWLSTDEKFQFIKTLAEKDKIVSFTEDIRSDRFLNIAVCLKENNLCVDTLYVSNIENYMLLGRAEDLKKYNETIQCLSNPQTALIYARGNKEIDELELKMKLGSS